jgi:diguanylate cyclase (GGDEF)-like protein
LLFTAKRYNYLMIRRRIIRACAERFPSGVHRELVAMLYTTVAPLIMVGVIAAAIGAIVAVRLGSLGIALVAVGIMAWTACRLALLLAYRKRAATYKMNGVEVRRFEALYAAGSIGSGLLLGGMNFAALRGEDAGIHMLTSALIFGYGAGLVVRISVRPMIFAASLTASVVPSIAGLLMHIGEPTQHGIPYGATALLYCAFALGSAESARFLYRSTVNQLVTARTLAGLARQDVLTGLANRLLLRERFDESIAAISRAGDLVALHLLDLDRFKPVNDRYGHPTGDAVLKAVADRLSSLIRPGDTAGRIGGDEFAIIQTAIRDVSQAQVLADRIVEALAAPFEVGSASINIGTSIGIAFAPRDGLDLEHLSSRADAALYAAKGRARGTVAIWDESSASTVAA